MVIPGISGTIVEVKPLKENVSGAKGLTTVQSFKLQEGNDWIFGDAWGCPDLSMFLNQPVIFVSNKSANNKLAGVGIKEKPSKDGSRKFKNLNLNSSMTVHSKATYEASKGQPAPITAKPNLIQAPVQKAAIPHMNQNGLIEQQADPFAPKPQPKTIIQGVTVGMAINNAVQLVVAMYGNKIQRETIESEIHMIASSIIRTSQRLERGELDGIEAAPSSANLVTLAPTIMPSSEPDNEGMDEDIPF